MSEVPANIADFLRDFHEAFVLGRISEIQSFYERGWKDMSKRFFATSPWPTVKEIAGIVKNDQAFLVLYRLLFYRHVLATLNTHDRPATFAQYVEAWKAYRAFFEFCIDTSKPTAAAREGSSKDDKEQPLPPVWPYDIMGDCVYLYQQFTDARSGSSSKTMELGATTEAEVAASWTLPEVLSLLHRTVQASNIHSILSSGQNPLGFRPLAGYFSLVCLSRFYTKLGDYGAALEALRPLRIFAADGTTFARLPKAAISIQYYASFALLMARRYEDAFRILNRTLATFQRMQGVFGDRDGGSGGGSNTLIQKTADKMLSLLALCVAVIPNASIGSVDDALRRPLRERHGETIEKLTGGDEAEVEAVFDKAAPGYFTWAPPKPAAAAASSGGANAGLEPTPAEAAATAAAAAASASLSAADLALTEDSPNSTFTFHLSQLQKDIAQRTGGLGGLRAFLRLYTSIDVAKLAQTSGMSKEDVRSALLSFKIKSWNPPAIGANPAQDEAAAAAAGGRSGAALAASSASAASSAASEALHFYLVSDTVMVEEAKQGFNMNSYFIRGIEQTHRIMREMNASSSSSSSSAPSSAPAAGGHHGHGHGHGGSAGGNFPSLGGGGRSGGGGGGGSPWGSKPGGSRPGGASPFASAPAARAGGGGNPWAKK